MDRTGASAISGQSPDRAEVPDALLRWYRAQGRSLPWRETQDPYRIWVIETLLQQTQIAQAAGRIERFFERLPTLEALAQADISVVLELWQGLGYYQRAHNLHRAARHLVAMGGWEAIRTSSDPLRLLESLPGIGAYTARAILSFTGWGAYLPVDGNLVRVLSRLWAAHTRVRAYYQKEADALPLSWRQREVAFALMDLAQLICTPQRPKCLLCPLSSACQALAIGRPTAYPPSAPKRERPTRHFLLHLYVDEIGVGLLQRPPAGLWGGLWTPPMEELSTPPGETPDFTHELTHFRLWGYVKRQNTLPEAAHYVLWEHLSRYALPAPIARLLAQEAKVYDLTFPMDDR